MAAPLEYHTLRVLTMTTQPMTTQPILTQHRFLILLDQDYEDLEYWYPKLRLLEAGAKSSPPVPGTGSGCVASTAIRPCVTR